MRTLVLVIAITFAQSAHSVAVFTLEGSNEKLICRTCTCKDLKEGTKDSEKKVDRCVETPRANTGSSPYDRIDRYSDVSVALHLPRGGWEFLASDESQLRFDEIYSRPDRASQLGGFVFTRGTISDDRVGQLAEDLGVPVVIATQAKEGDGDVKQTGPCKSFHDDCAGTCGMDCPISGRRELSCDADIFQGDGFKFDVVQHCVRAAPTGWERDRFEIGALLLAGSHRFERDVEWRENGGEIFVDSPDLWMFHRRSNVKVSVGVARTKVNVSDLSADLTTLAVGGELSVSLCRDCPWIGSGGYKYRGTLSGRREIDADLHTANLTLHYALGGGRAGVLAGVRTNAATFEFEQRETRRRETVRVGRHEVVAGFEGRLGRVFARTDAGFDGDRVSWSATVGLTIR